MHSVIIRNFQTNENRVLYNGSRFNCMLYIEEFCTDFLFSANGTKVMSQLDKLFYQHPTRPEIKKIADELYYVSCKYDEYTMVKRYITQGYMYNSAISKNMFAMYIAYNSLCKLHLDELMPPIENEMFDSVVNEIKDLYDDEAGFHRFLKDE